MTIEGEFASIRVLQGIYPPTFYFKIKLKNREKNGYNFFAYKAELILANEHKRIANSVNLESFEMLSLDERAVEPAFELDYKKLDFIEEKRTGDISFIILLKITGIYREQKTDGGYESISEGFSHGFVTSDIRISSPENRDEIVIEQSKWLKILGELDYGKINIVELSIPTITPDTIFNHALKHFDDGKKNLRLGKYSDVLTSCIHVIEELDRLINLDEKERKRKHNLMQVMGKEKAEALKKTKEIFYDNFLHFGEHQARPVRVTIDRLDAELALHFTLAILNYFARQIADSNKKSR